MKYNHPFLAVNDIHWYYILFLLVHAMLSTSPARVRPTSEERARRVSMRENSVHRLPGETRVEAEDATWTVVDPARLVVGQNPDVFAEDGVYVMNGHRILVIRTKRGRGTHTIGADRNLRTDSGLLAVGNSVRVDTADSDEARHFLTCGRTYVSYDKNGFTGAVLFENDDVVMEDEDSSGTETEPYTPE